MPQRPDLPCADCGKLMWRSMTSLPEGRARCQPCRRKCRATSAPCPTCGEAVTRYRGVYCSRSCSNQRVRKRGPARSDRVCCMCGASYRATYADQRTCGRACGLVLRQCEGTIAAPKTKVAWRVCRQCGQSYTFRGGRRCGCPAYVPTSGVRSVACRDCGAAFDYVIISNYPARCVGCREIERRRRRREGRIKRKAQLRGAAVEPVNIRRVYERDRWRCGLCRGKVDKRLKYPHPRSASLDHVLPIAHGGAHSMANVQLAHLDCNHAKSDGGTQQLALIG